MQALKCFSVLAYENTQVSMTLMNGEESVLFPPFFRNLDPERLLQFHSLVVSVLSVLVDGERLAQVFVKMMQRDQPIEMQLTAAKWLVIKAPVGPA